MTGAVQSIRIKNPSARAVPDSRPRVDRANLSRPTVRPSAVATVLLALLLVGCETVSRDVPADRTGVVAAQPDQSTPALEAAAAESLDGPVPLSEVLGVSYIIDSAVWGQITEPTSRRLSRKAIILVKITTRGKKVLAPSPERIDNAYLSQFEEFQEFRGRSSVATKTIEHFNGSRVDDRIPDKAMRVAHKEIEQALRQELLNHGLTAPPDFFEGSILNHLIEMGYGRSVEKASWPLGKSGDGRFGDDGVNSMIDQKALGLDRVYIQTRRYAPGNNIGSPQIGYSFESIDRFKAVKGHFVMTLGFSSSTENTAAHFNRRVVLIDCDRLTGLMARYNVGCPIP